ncbi:MAG: hypothetical protein JXA96_08160 [Sedimentisphaerales bacterium]|nr:hypothetical protein [Sedimentisphaerales bacterium]
MKNTHVCPKCESKNILHIPGMVRAHGAGNNIPAGWTILSAVKVSRYLCTECGYSEEWVIDRDDIKRLIEKYFDIE